MNLEQKPLPDEPTVNSLDFIPSDNENVAQLALDIQKIEDHGTAPVEQPVQFESSIALAQLPISPVSTEQKKPKKTWLIGGVMAALIFVFGSGGWAAYALWYQQPDKVIGDTLFNSMTTKTASMDGTVTVSNKDGVAATIGIKGSGGYKEGVTGTTSVSFKYLNDTTLKIGAEGTRTSTGDYYLRLFGLQDSYNSATEAMLKNKGTDSETDGIISTVTAMVQPFIDKVDNQWIRFAMDDISKYDSALANQYECMNKVMTDVGNDDSKSKLIEIGQLYQRYKIIVYDKNLGTANGAMGMLVHIDEKELQKFINDLGSTKLVKELEGCDKSGKKITPEKVNESVAKDDPEHFELWVDQWTHELKRIYSKIDQGTGDEKISIVADFSFKANVPVDIKSPDNAKTIDQLFPELKSQLGLTMTEKI